MDEGTTKALLKYDIDEDFKTRFRYFMRTLDTNKTEEYNAKRDLLTGFLRTYQAHDFDTWWTELVAGTLTVLVVLGVLNYSFHHHRKLKVVTSIALQMVLAAFVNLCCHYPAKCTDKEPCKDHNIAWLKFERNGENNIIAFFGGLALVCKLANSIISAFGTATAWFSMQIADAACKLLGVVPFPDAPIQDVLKDHWFLIILAAAVCVAVKVPGMMCMLQCLSSSYQLFCDAIYSVVWVTFFVAVALVFHWLLKLCGYDLWLMFQKARREYAAKHAATFGSTTGPFGSTTAVLADDHNVKMLPVLFQLIGDPPKFEGNRVGTRMWTYVQEKCTVKGEKPEHKHMEEAFAAQNILWDDKAAKTKCLINQLERLGKLDPPAKKKK